MSRNIEEAFIKMSNRITEERISNSKILEHVLQNPIVYGSEVQFMHVTSKSFLKADISCSDSDKSAYKFELSDEFSAKMVFKICPKYNVRQEGEPVQFGDQILIHSPKLDCYVNFSMNAALDMDIEVDIPEETPLISKPFEHRKLDRRSKRYEAHISQFRDCVWKIYHYGSHKTEDSMVVRGGDIIKLKHTEIEAYLAADVGMQSHEPEIYGRIYYGNYPEENDCINTLWEVEILNYQDRGGNCEILNDQKEFQQIRLRHLLTGKVMDYGGVTIDDETWRVPVLSKRGSTDNGYAVVFHGFANNPKKELFFNTAYSIGFRIADDMSPKFGELNPIEEINYRYITMHMDKDYSQMESVNTARKNSGISTESVVNQPETIKMFKPLKESEFTTKKRLFIVESLEPSAEHAFVIQKVDSQRQSDISFLASSLPSLLHFRDMLKANKERMYYTWEGLVKVASVLKQLIFFIHKLTTKFLDHDPATFEGIN